MHVGLRRNANSIKCDEIDAMCMMNGIIKLPRILIMKHESQRKLGASKRSLYSPKSLIQMEPHICMNPRRTTIGKAVVNIHGTFPVI